MAMGELFEELSHTLPSLFWTMITGLARIGAISSYFIRDTFRAHFNLIAQYTAPIEQELLNKTPPKPKDLNPLGQIALTLFPLTIASWLAALTIAPLIYNSILLFIAGFVRVTNLALLDLPVRKLNVPEGNMAWYRIIFGLPGLLIGGSLGGIAAGLISLVRLTINSLKSGKYSVIKITNLALDPEDYLTVDQTERSIIEKYGFGFPGLILGGIVGSLGFTVAGLGRVAINSWFSFIGLNALAFNLVRQEKTIRELNDGRTPFRIYGLGLPGLILGSLTAPVAVAIAGVERIAIESWRTTKEFFFAAMNWALPTEQVEPSQDSIEEGKKEKRSKLNAYGFGAPGVLLGVLSGSIGFAGVVFARTLANSLASGAFSFIHVTNLALDPEDRIPQMQEEKSNIKRYGFGFPGIVLGGIAGGLGFTVAGLGRVAINSWSSFIGLNASAFNLVRQEKTIRELNDGRTPFRIYGLGLPGLILGSLTAPVAVAIAGVERIAIESWRTTKEFFFAAVNLALPTEQPEPSQESAEEGKKEKRSKLNAYGFGAPGVLLGVLSGSIGFAGVVFARTLANSLASGTFSFIHVTNLALDPEDRIPQMQEEKSHIKRYGFGFPGIVLGGFAGGLGFTVAGLGRVAINSWSSFIGLNASAFNLVRQEKTNRELNDGRTPFRIYGLGLPGLILGSLTAPVAMVIASSERIARESWKTAKEIFIVIVNTVLPTKKPEEAAPERTEGNKRSKLDTYGFGAPGLLLGIISGGIGFVGALCARILINSFISALYMSILITNKALDPADHISQIEDDRSTLDVCGFGLPGLFLGALTGRLGFFAVGLGRVAINSFFTFVNVNSSAFNLVRQEQNARLKDERSPVLIYGLGLPGLILGGLTAPIAITIAGAERSARESWKTTKELFLAAVNLALPASKQEKTPAQSKDNRSKLNTYVFGAPGLLLGLISGGIGVIAIGFARTVTNSFKSGLNSFILVTNFALDSQHHLNPSQAKRSPIEKYGFGLPGLVLGGIAGGLGFTVAGLGRVTAHSFFTFIRINTAAFNRVRPSKSTEELKDERTPFLIYGLGLPGLILGSITAPIAIALASAERIAIESWQTTKEVFFIFVRLATPLEEIEAQESHHSQAKSDNKNRSKLDTYIFGAPGILLGTLSGSIGFTFVALRQVVRHSIDTGIRMFTSISNVGLSDKEQFNYKPLEKEDNRGWQAKYLLGFPGAFIGAGVGILMLVGIGSVKGVSNTFYSWLSLSGSVLNGSLELPLFSGLAGDKRTRNQKIIGSLGYAVALVSTLPVGILILVSKKIIPVISALILGAICSPLVALLKGVNQSLQKPRFDEKELSEEDDKIQRFKNIYSALTPLGQLAESSKIPEQQNGRKGPLCFTRKAFTFNISTVTEYTLDQLLSAYRASTNKAAFFEPQGEFETVLEGVKEHYKEISCLDSEYHTAARDEQIDKIGNFARDYILNKETTVPSHLYSNPNKWTAIFWGQESKNSEVSTNSQLQASMELS